jgi:hypothetical protein
MTQSHPALAVAALSLTAVMVLAILVANQKTGGEVSFSASPLARSSSRF